ncbi:phosphoglycerate mutase family protein [Scardovia inopinata]|uniref:phosphoglycerate mutase (2,3-diphosphoglycerate-dependent) n=1 Tax=Scardovia inopinata F0304 TaxID=641146 RepID=W5IGJ8_SCAIO|nr:histidine phosphatase family protein [Scardovia inopinata]EFG25957.1 hypothetical protein HMPREF9020_01024 [Scardovia inopinata F0304]BAR07416.1 putative phosphoglycerate mutase [Scardovia inopinata JCM 12537]SUV51490.1 phosphoglycerate mutase family protein [Scardovia inopinata]
MAETKASRGKFILLRHGQTVWSESGQYTGRTDIPLTAEGEEQARQAGERLRENFGPELNRAFVLTSPLIRARRTAALAGFESAIADDNLMEFDYGPAEGRTRAQVAAAIGEDTWNIWDRGPLTLPQSLRGTRREKLEGQGTVTIVNGIGESAAMAGARTRAVINRVLPKLEAGENVVCVAHAHILRILTTQWLGMEPSCARMLELETAHFCVLAWHHEDRVIYKWNI